MWSLSFQSDDLSGSRCLRKGRASHLSPKAEVATQWKGVYFISHAAQGVMGNTTGITAVETHCWTQAP